MANDFRVFAIVPKGTSEIARDLRAFARDGVAPSHAAKLLAVAAELEAMAGATNPAE